MEAAATERACVVCGGSLEGRRPQTRTCSPACRAEASRLRRLLAGDAVDGFSSLADRLGRLYEAVRRRQTAQNGRTHLDACAGGAGRTSTLHADDKRWRESDADVLG